MTNHSSLRLSLLIAASLSMMTIGAPGWAQPTGNPKGTPAPVSQEMSKSPATGSAASAASGGASSGKIDMGPASARLAPSREPGTGTAGGLPKRNVGDGTASGASTSGAASAPTIQPTSPAR